MIELLGVPSFFERVRPLAPLAAICMRRRFPKPVEEYHDEHIRGITAKLVQRIQAEPFNLVGTLVFLGAIIHTFLGSSGLSIPGAWEPIREFLEERTALQQRGWEWVGIAHLRLNVQLPAKRLKHLKNGSWRGFGRSGFEPLKA
jgi:hypothetical protein